MKRLFTRFLLLISSGALLWQVVMLAWLLLQKGDPTTPITVQVRSGSYGVIDGNGVELVAADWFYLSRFGTNGRATGKKNETDAYCSVINAKGEVLGSFEADSCDTFGVRNVRRPHQKNQRKPIVRRHSLGVPSRDKNRCRHLAEGKTTHAQASRSIKNSPDLG